MRTNKIRVAYRPPHPKTQSQIYFTKITPKTMHLKNYWEPTPRFARAAGDALLSIGTMITAYNIAMDDKTVALICLFASVAGKFLSNFYADDKPQG